MPDGHENPNRITELREVLWSYIEEFEQYRRYKKRPGLDRMVRVAHAVGQLSAAYLRVVEVEAALHTIPELQAQVKELTRAQANGHHYPATVADLN